MKKFVLTVGLIGAGHFALAATSTTSVSDIVTPAATTTVTAPAATAAPKKSKWTQAVDYEHITSAASAHRGAIDDGSIANAFFEVRKDIGGGQSMALRAVFLRNAGEEALTLLDPYIFYSNKNFFNSTVRANIPMGEWSRAIGRHEIRHDMGIDVAKFGKTTISFANTMRGYFYSKNSDGQRSFRDQAGFSATYAVNDKIAPYVDLSHEANWYHSGVGRTMSDVAAGKPATKNPDDVFSNILEIGVTLKPVDGFSIRPYVSQTYSEGSFKFGNEDEVSYAIDFYATL